MTNPNGIAQYQQVTMNTVTPQRMIVMLYEGALRFLAKGRDALVSGDVQNRSTNLNKAHAIVTELRHALDHGTGATFTRELESLYDYVGREINEAVVTRDPSHIDNAVQTLEPLLDAWRQIPNTDAEEARKAVSDAVEVANLTAEGTDLAKSPASPASPDGTPAEDRKSNLCVAV